jgi:hypothetical protein
MKTYVMTTGSVFALIVVAHIWRVLEEGTHLARDPFFILITVAATALSAWACWLLKGAPR